MDSLFIIVSYLLEGVEELQYLRKEAMLVLNQVLAGRQGAEKELEEDVVETCKLVMYKYLETEQCSMKNAIATVNSGRLNLKNLKISVLEAWKTVKIY